MWIILGMLAVFLLTANGTITHSFNEKKKPLAAIEFLKAEKLPGNMMNNDEFGDFLIYGAYPDYKVFIDGRLDMYGQDSMKEYYNIIEFRPGWKEILEGYNVNWIIIPTKSAFSRFLDQNMNWDLIYSDKVASIFIKDIVSNQHLIKKYRHVKLFEIEHKAG
jgi:hypothetical protein